MPLFLPLNAWRRFTFSCDAMLAGTSHYPYTSSSHDLLSGCKDRHIFWYLQIFEQRKQRKVHFSLLSREKIRWKANYSKDIFSFLWKFVILYLHLPLAAGMSSEGDGTDRAARAERCLHQLFRVYNEERHPQRMPLFLPLNAWRRFTFSCDAMLAGTSHYPYTSSSHDLLSGCKDRHFSLIFQTFCNFFLFRVSNSK